MADNNKVFVIYGRNERARGAMFTFLRSIGLLPLEWPVLVKATGKASPYVGEVLEKGFEIAQAAVVLLTPDDIGMLQKPLQGLRDPDHETKLTGQARQNVIFEAGMAMGSYPDRTVVVELGKLRPVSDMTGRHVIRMNDTLPRRQDLAQRLHTAGCAVDMTGVDWHTEGRFDDCIPPEHEPGTESVKLLNQYIAEAAEKKKSTPEQPRIPRALAETVAIVDGVMQEALAPVRNEDLTPTQVVVLLSVAWQLSDPHDRISIHRIRSEAESNGIDPIATTLGIRALVVKGMLERFTESTGWNNEPEVVYGVSDPGMNWLVANEDTLPARIRPDDNESEYDAPAGGPPPNDDIPF